MSHLRTQIRDRVAATLDSTGAKISKSRLHDWQPSELPGIAVYTLDEPSRRANTGRTLERELTLVLDLHVKKAVTDDGVDEDDAEVDDAVDDLCVLVEQVMDADPRINKLALDSWLTKTTVGLSGEGDYRHGVGRLEYMVRYRTEHGAPEG